MLQTAFGLVHDTAEVGFLQSALRLLFSSLDIVIYTLVDVVYKVIFNIADAKIISSEVMSDFFGRVQLILGVIMIFRLAISMLQTVINPDLLTDQKNGFSKIITKVVVMLILLVSIVPLKNIPSSQISSDTSYNAYIKDSGILFGTLYSMQHRVLQGNVIGKLILGTTDNKLNENRISSNVAKQEDGESIALFILRKFISPNLKEGVPGKDEDYLEEDNLVCSFNEKARDDIEGVKSTISSTAVIAGGAAFGWGIAQASTIIGTAVAPGVGTAIGAAVGVAFVGGKAVFDFFTDDAPIMKEFYATWAGEGEQRLTISELVSYSGVACDDGWAFTYFPLFSTICGGILLFFLIGICIQIAIRSIKLAVLRLLSPIAIISYINPKSSESGAFSNWVKMLTSTYIDLFLRLAIMYFVVFLVLEITNGHLDLPLSEGAIGAISTVLIIVGLFFFAKNAPKFIKQALGIKDDGGSFFGFGKLAALGGSLFGGIGSAATNYRASREEGRNVVTSLLSAGAGGLAGSATGLKAALSAEKQEGKAAREAMQKRNQLRASHSTLPGRVGDSIYSTFSGRSLAEKEQKELDLNNKAFDEFKKYKSVMEDEALKKDDIYGTSTVADSTGQMRRINYNVLSAALERAKHSGQATFTVRDENGIDRTYTTNDWNTTKLNDLKESQAGDYAQDVLAGRADNGTLMNSFLQAERAAKDAGVGVFDGTYGGTKKSMKQSKDKATSLETEMKHIKRRANYQANKNK